MLKANTNDVTKDTKIFVGVVTSKKMKDAKIQADEEQLRNIDGGSRLYALKKTSTSVVTKKYERLERSVYL